MWHAQAFPLLLLLSAQMDSSSAAASLPNEGHLLVGKDDRYGGFIIDPLSLPADPPSFLRALQNSLAHWKSKGKRGIWLKLPVKNSDLVPHAIQEGFCYHHAEKDYLMLTFWIPESSSTLPSNASHQVGVGAMVINDQNEVLVVQEITGPTQGSGVWKMPTGVVHQGEDILTAVIREVQEETGVETEFVELLGVRQSHDVAFGKSDLFFLCKLRPLSSEIKIQETEIAAAKWIPMDEFKSQPFNSASGLLTRIADIASASMEGKYQGFGAEVLTFGFRNKGSYFYHNIQDVMKFPTPEP